MPASDRVRRARREYRFYLLRQYLKSRRFLASICVLALSSGVLSWVNVSYEGQGLYQILRTHDDLRAWASVIAAFLGAVSPALLMAGIAFFDRRSSTNRSGLLVVNELIKLLRLGDVDDFCNICTAQRRRAIRQVGRIAATIEGIPNLLGVRDQGVVLAAQQRASWVRAIQGRIATMSSEKELSGIIFDLSAIRYLYNTGQWMKLPSAPAISEPRSSLVVRISLGVVAAISFVAIVAVVTLIAMSKLPSSAIPICFILGVLFYSSMVRLGVSGDGLKQAVDLVSTAQGSLIHAGDKGKSDSAPPKTD